MEPMHGDSHSGHRRYYRHLRNPYRHAPEYPAKINSAPQAIPGAMLAVRNAHVRALIRGPGMRMSFTSTARSVLESGMGARVRMPSTLTRLMMLPMRK
jgi:hypothetical protein